MGRALMISIMALGLALASIASAADLTDEEIKAIDSQLEQLNLSNSAVITAEDNARIQRAPAVPEGESLSGREAKTSNAEGNSSEEESGVLLGE